MKGQTKRDEDVCLNIDIAIPRAFNGTDLFTVLPPALKIQIIDLPVVYSQGAESAQRADGFARNPFIYLFTILHIVIYAFFLSFTYSFIISF